jgi:tetratricopeptide (TPR) repeat protein
MKPGSDLFDEDGLARMLERAERDPRAADELERARLQRPAPPVRDLPPPLERPWFLAAAAAALVLLALGAWLAGRDDRRDSRRALASNGPPPYLTAELRAPDAPDDGFARAMEPYVRGDWSAAAGALGAWVRTRPEHGPGWFYLAAVEEALGTLDTAAEHYRAATRAPDALLADHARWRLALLLVRRDRWEDARAELEVLRAGGGELASNARALMAELER